uniref:Uncharacterized protein n=1 Tax=Anguilla anguilla TaxID=7936 RepID=A0A0E9W9G4_ANGAN
MRPQTLTSHTESHGGGNEMLIVSYSTGVSARIFTSGCEFKVPIGLGEPVVVSQKLLILVPN